MNNFIEYFYYIKVDKIKFIDNYYSFTHNGYLYKLFSYDGDMATARTLYEINRKLIRNTLMSEIIINHNNEVISHYNGINYILIKLFVNPKKNIFLNEISLLSNTLYKSNIDSNWGILWSNKIDYLENLINESGKKYPMMVDSFNYFVGMCENAISYFNSINIDNDYKYVISHKNITRKDTIESLYNPMNIIFDFKVRDVAEYLKNSFFNNNYNVSSELTNYLKVNSLSIMEVKLLIARLLYPSFYFELYEDILVNNNDEKILVDIISRVDEYENYLCDLISFLKLHYDVDEVNWLKKK